MSYPATDAQEWADAARHDARKFVRVGGLPMDADDVPDRADLGES